MVVLICFRDLLVAFFKQKSVKDGGEKERKRIKGNVPNGSNNKNGQNYHSKWLPGGKGEGSEGGVNFCCWEDIVTLTKKL